MTRRTRQGDTVQMSNDGFAPSMMAGEWRVGFWVTWLNSTDEGMVTLNVRKSLPNDCYTRRRMEGEAHDNKP